MQGTRDFLRSVMRMEAILAADFNPIGDSLMRPIQQIIDDAPQTMNVPQELWHRRIEVIFWALDEPAVRHEPDLDADGWPAGFSKPASGCQAGDPSERAQQQKKNA